MKALDWMRDNSKIIDFGYINGYYLSIILV